MTKTESPPPGSVHELAERAVEYVRTSLHLTLDYQPETLPLLDHYLSQAPRDEGSTELLSLLAWASGAYFGEVARRALGGEWRAEGDDPAAWLLRLTGGVTFSPIGFAAEALAKSEVEGFDGSFEVPADDREVIQEILEQHAPVPEDEYYSLTGRLETLMYVVDLCVGRQATRSPDRT